MGFIENPTAHARTAFNIHTGFNKRFIPLNFTMGYNKINRYLNGPSALFNYFERYNSLAGTDDKCLQLTAWRRSSDRLKPSP